MHGLASSGYSTMLGLWAYHGTGLTNSSPPTKSSDKGAVASPMVLVFGGSTDDGGLAGDVCECRVTTAH